MARSLNSVTLLGNITRDPDLRVTTTGQNVISISLALNRSFKDSNGDWQEVADYIDITAWGHLAQKCSEYIKRGSRILVVGRLQQRRWEQDGQKRSKVEVLATDVVFLDMNKEKKAEPEQRQTKEEKVIDKFIHDKPMSEMQSEAGTREDEPINLDDIPF